MDRVDERDLPLLEVEPEEAPEPEPGPHWSPPPPPAPRQPVSRRRLLVGGLLGAVGFLGVGGAAATAFGVLDTDAEDGLLRVPGSPAELVALTRAKGPLLIGRDTALVDYPPEALDKAAAVYDDITMVGLRLGLIALYLRAPHQGYRVRFCGSSGWWQDDADGSKFSRVGEKEAGPSPRGLDLHPVAAPTRTGRLVTIVDTTRLIVGARLGADTTHQQIGGPHCFEGRS